MAYICLVDRNKRFEKLKNGTLQLDDKFIVSEKAWKEREGSSMFVEVGKEIRVEDLKKGQK